MEKMVLVIDESGAKGYAKTKEKYEGEIGVMAGFMYPEADITTINKHLALILHSYQENQGKKFHITDLSIQSQDDLRKDIFDFIIKSKIQWYYQAIYAEGFHQSEFLKNRGGQEDGNKSLHVTLFESMLVMSLCIARSICIDLDLEIKTDRIDAGTKKKFAKATEAISHVFLRKDRVVFRYIPIENSSNFKKEYWNVSTKFSDALQFNKLNITINAEHHPLTVMADVLANSVYYYLKKAQKDNPNISLNNKETLKDHPVVHLALVADNEENFPSLTDIVYRRTKV